VRTKIRRRPNGRWYVYAIDGDGSETWRRGFRTHCEAKDAAKTIEVDSPRGSYIDPSRMTLSQGYASGRRHARTSPPTAGSSRASCGPRGSSQ